MFQLMLYRILMMETHCFETQAMCFKYLGIIYTGLNLIRHMRRGPLTMHSWVKNRSKQAKQGAASASVEIWSLQGRVVQLQKWFLSDKAQPRLGSLCIVLPVKHCGTEVSINRALKRFSNCLSVCCHSLQPGKKLSTSIHCLESNYIADCLLCGTGQMQKKVDEKK